MKTGLSSNLFHALQFTACRPSHNAHDHGADSEEHEVQKAPSTLYRTCGCGVNGQRLYLTHFIQAVKVNHMSSKTTRFCGECQWSGERNNFFFETRHAQYRLTADVAKQPHSVKMIGDSSDRSRVDLSEFTI